MDETRDDEPAAPPPDDETPEAAKRVWGSEHPRRTGAAWRRLQRLEPIAEPESPPPRRAQASDASPAAPSDTPSSTLMALLELRRDTERRLDSIGETVAQLARSVQEAVWSSSGTQVKAEMDALSAAVADVRRSLRSAEGPTALAEIAQDSGTRTVLERIRGEMEALRRGVAELRTSLPSATSDELAALLQAEARSTREALSALRMEGPAGARERADALRAEVESLRETVRMLADRLEDIPSDEHVARTVSEGSDRVRAQVEETSAANRRLLEEVRHRTERLDGGVTELAARLSAHRPEPERLIAMLRKETDAIRAELGQATAATDARARNILAALAKEVVTIGEQQRELREEIRRLASRIVGRPVL